ncbi:response regulator transcription factor [Litoribacillus peritrichatus]|uniref:Cationic peptide response regulator transcription factor CprR n=1 Tax=Litoribacillus peritrichatus TaxID=718191 RepID=A0ABP7M878_9GAMM
MLVLLVEDDLDLAELIIEFLESEGLEVDVAYHGEMALSLVRDHNSTQTSGQYDVIITDVTMPKMDGLSFCAQMRAEGMTTPCLMLTARTTLNDKLAGFEHGADDYLVKPFELEELLARIYALSRRFQNSASKLQVADITLDAQAQTVFKNNHPVVLAPLEFTLLEHLMRNSPNVVSRSKLEGFLWPDEEPSSNALKMVIYRLRQALNDDSESPKIQTRRGVGVVLLDSTDRKTPHE